MIDYIQEEAYRYYYLLNLKNRIKKNTFYKQNTKVLTKDGIGFVKCCFKKNSGWAYCVILDSGKIRNYNNIKKI